MTRQPGLGRPAVHRRLARQGRAACAELRPEALHRGRRRRRRRRPPARSPTPGATLFVAGSAIFGADDPAAAYARDRRGRRRRLARALSAAAVAGRSARRRAPATRPARPSDGPARATRRAHQLGQRAAAADREQVGAGDRVAAVGERDQRAAAVAADAQPLRRPATPSIAPGAPGSPSVARHGRTENTCGAPRGGSARHRRLAERPVAPALGELLDLVERSSRGRRCGARRPPRSRSSRAAGAPRRRGRSG